MRNEILAHLDDAEQLEKLYRSNRTAFCREFNSLTPELTDNGLLRFWKVRLNRSKEESTWGHPKDLRFMAVAALIAAFVVKLPEILHLNEEAFYTRNAGFIVFPFLTAFFAWKNNLAYNKIGIIGTTLLGSILFINFLPGSSQSDIVVLSCIHLAIILWYLLGIAFTGESPARAEKRLAYLNYNGDLAVITALILFAGGILSGMTIGLFSLIGYNIEKFYANYIILVGLPAAPLLGTYLIRSNPQLVGKISPVIARIFSPLVLVMLVIYLVAILYARKDPYNDREFLQMFNGLLLGVMAIIVFSVAEISKTTNGRGAVWLLFLLSAVTIVVNGIALSAILFRISSWGFTPNRTAVLGGNILILVNLVLVAMQLARVLTRKTALTVVGNTISRYLPVYAIWAAIVTFLFPFIFGAQ